MCPICWINGILLLLFGANALSFGTEWYIVAPAFLFLGYGFYKILDGIKRGKNFSHEQKIANRKSINRFSIGVVIGIYTGFAIMFAISNAEHQRMHDLLEQHGIEEHDH